jgi:3-phenylpropionate/trans-cinnamate dioxygenase ferredoxin reductase subunit
VSKQTFIIVGASLAGAKAAEELRTRGFDGQLLLIGSEPERPYERPPLTKDYLRGESERAKAFVHEPDFYDQHEIELMTGTTVVGIDATMRRVTVEGARSSSSTACCYDWRGTAAASDSGRGPGRGLLPSHDRRL